VDGPRRLGARRLTAEPSTDARPADPRPGDFGPAGTLAVLGGAGRTGRRVVEYALAAGYAVRALARRPDALADLASPRVTVVAGDALDPAAVARLVAGADAAVSALGGGTTADPGTARSGGVRNAAAALAAAAAPNRPGPRLLFVAGGGILDAAEGGLRQDRPGFPAVFRLVSAEHRRAWEAVRDTGLRWTAVCTGDIVPGERTGAYRHLPDVMPEGGRRISVEDLADFLLAELRARRYERRRVGLAY
jgi:putative NADH-flavin reductase